MIDYEKLKTASELAGKLDNAKLVVEFRYNDGEVCYLLYWFSPKPEHYITYTLEKLIDKLTKLTQPESKDSDEVWILNNLNQPTKAFIVRRMGGDVDLAFEDGTRRYGVIEEPYPTKESLIEAQIAHWTAMREPELLKEGCALTSGTGTEPTREHEVLHPSKCQHEPNGQTSLIGYPLAFKCKKCGVYYR